MLFSKVRVCLGLSLASLLGWNCGNSLGATTYRVGPSQQLTAIGQVPWELLLPGDQVLVDWRATPYKEKWVICRQGTEKEPISVRGVPGPRGELPVIDGNGASTRSQLKYWGQERGVIKIGGAENPALCIPQYIILENLEIRGARSPGQFRSSDGQLKTYKVNAAALYVEKAQHLTVRHCVLRDSGNGLFVSSNDESASGDILVESCQIYGNGMPGNGGTHNVYTAALGITFQFNYLGELGEGCRGNNLKDRSAGLVVRYNWMEGGDKPLDLVDAADSVLIRKDPRYQRTFVYGNILIKPLTRTHPQVVHYGGDSPRASYYRKGKLYFYNNTVVSQRKTSTTLFWLSSKEESVDCRNNIFYGSAPGKFLHLLQNAGKVELSHNWLKQGCILPVGLEDRSSISSLWPGFKGESDYHLAATSPCLHAGTAPAPEALPENDVRLEYVKPLSSRTLEKGKAPNIGALGTD